MNISWKRGAVVVVVWMGALAAVAAGRAQFNTHGSAFGAFGPEGPRLREQLWIVPGADPRVPLRATVFQPPLGNTQSTDRRPLVVINHGSDEGTREAVSMPVFFWLSKWFVDRGFVVLLPQRRGHGATGGEPVEGMDSCGDPDHYSAGMAAADDIENAIRYMSAQPFIDPSQTVVVGVSTGGWGSLALAGRNLSGVKLIVNFAGGRGGHAYGMPHRICGPERLIEAVAAFGRAAKVRTLWFYSENDSYFSPELATAMAAAWEQAGGLADLHVLPRYGDDGHMLVVDPAGWELWGKILAQSLPPHRALYATPPLGGMPSLRGFLGSSFQPDRVVFN